MNLALRIDPEKFGNPGRIGGRRLMRISVKARMIRMIERAGTGYSGKTARRRAAHIDHHDSILRHHQPFRRDRRIRLKTARAA